MDSYKGDGVDWTDVTLEMVQWQALVNTVAIIQIP